MPRLSSGHHTLIQALLSRGPLKEGEFCKIFRDLTGENSGSQQQQFNDSLLKINKELSYVQFELRASINQYDGNVYYGVVNNIADEQSKLGTKYTVPQIAFYKGIIEAIMQDVTAQGSISSIDALNIRLENQVVSGTESQSQGDLLHIPPAFKNFSISQKEKTLNELVRDHWLCTTSDGNIGLGLKSFLDLRSWFHNNEVPSCAFCNEAGVKAVLCANESCTVRIHQYCLKKKFSQRRAERVCPGCGTEWQYEVTKQEAVEYGEEPTQSQLPSGSKGKRVRSDAEDTTVENEDGPNRGRPPVGPTRKRVKSLRVDNADSSLQVPTRRSSRLM